MVGIGDDITDVVYFFSLGDWDLWEIAWLFLGRGGEWGEGWNCYK